jgi:hypothetical protein
MTPPGPGYVPVILLAGTILWAVADTRPMAAAATWIAVALSSASFYSLSLTPTRFWTASLAAGWVRESLALAALVVAAAGIRQLRRQSAL